MLLAQRQKEHRTKASASCGTPVNRLTNGIADKAFSPFSVDFRRRAEKRRVKTIVLNLSVLP